MLDEFSFALLTAGILLGLRHGIDWDHIAAISDLTGSQQQRLRSLGMGTLYAFGHAAAVIVLGLIAILFGTLLPEWLDRYLEIIVGLTLLLLSAWLIWNMVRYKGRVIFRSRWMLIFELLRNIRNKILKKSKPMKISLLNNFDKNRNYIVSYIIFSSTESIKSFKELLT